MKNILIIFSILIYVSFTFSLITRENTDKQTIQQTFNGIF